MPVYFPCWLPVAGRVSELIVEANGGRCPVTILQWRRVARRFGITVKFLRVPGPFQAALQGDLLFVRWPGPGHRLAPDVALWLLHEISEAVLTWEGEPPCIVPVRGTTAETRHTLAGLVETFCTAG